MKVPLIPLNLWASGATFFRKRELKKVHDAIGVLKLLNIDCRGPITTPGNKQIFLIGGCILTDAEIISLYERGNFSPTTVGKLLSDLRSPQWHGPCEVQPMDRESPENRRRSQRVMLQLALLVRWEMATGKSAQIQAFTVMVNAHGGLLEAPVKMTVGQRMVLINPQTGKEVGCKVVWVKSTSEKWFETAFEFDQHSPRFWPIAFPPLDWEAPPEAA